MLSRKRNFWPALAMLAIAGCSGGSGGGSIAAPPGNPPPPAAAPQISIQQVFTQLPAFAQPVGMQQAPGDASRWFVLEKNGIVQTFANNPASSSSSVFLDISSVVNSSGEGGLLGMAFHPNYPLTPEVFISYTRTGAVTPLVSHVSRFLSTNNGLTLNAATEQIILTLPQEQTNHNGGDLHFGADGYLYAGFGDSGGGGDPREYAQDTGNVHGSIVRLDVTGGTPYAIPAGNPFSANAVCTGGFANGTDACPEIYAWGLRNPWRFSFDALTGKLWAGDVGQGNWEEIDVIEVGENYGWNDREGAHCFDPATGCATNFKEPITEYDHSMGDRSVTGGYVYRGSAIIDLAGWYVFGDFVSGRIFAIPEDSQDGVLPETLLESGLSVVSFAESNDGELYVIDFGVGTIHEVQAAP